MIILYWLQKQQILWIAKWHENEANGIAADRWLHRAPIVWQELNRQIEMHKSMAEHLRARVAKPKGELG